MSDIKLRKLDGKLQVWDVLRSKWVACTPEERVRQWLIGVLEQSGINPSRMASEVKVNVNERNLRADIVVYGGGDFVPKMICECKAPKIKVGDDTFLQAAMYNVSLQVPYLLITNGDKLYCAEIDLKTGSYKFLPNIPVIE